jgi:hypothetical protein
VGNLKLEFEFEFIKDPAAAVAVAPVAARASKVHKGCNTDAGAC